MQWFEPGLEVPCVKHRQVTFFSLMAAIGISQCVCVLPFLGIYCALELSTYSHRTGMFCIILAFI